MVNNTENEYLDSLSGNLEKFLKTETVVGEPIAIGEITLVPIISVMFGCGAGGDAGHDSKEKNKTGSGGGAIITPNAILVIKKDEVTMLQIKEKSNLDEFKSIVSDIVSKINIKIDKENEEEK